MGEAQQRRAALAYLAGIVQVCVVPTAPCVSGTQHVVGHGPNKQVAGSAAAGWVQPDVSLLQPLRKERRPWKRAGKTACGFTESYLETFWKEKPELLNDS